MFQTIPTGELHQLDEGVAVAAGVRYWTYVLQPLHLPWYHVDLLSPEGHRLVFSSDYRQWLSMGQKSSSGLKLASVRLVSPGWLNGTDGWLLQPLHQILIGKEPQTDQEALVFVVEGGARYVHSEIETPEPLLRELKPIFDSMRLPRMKQNRH